MPVLIFKSLSIPRSCTLLAVRISAYLMVGAVFLYLINNVLVFWQDLPGPYKLFFSDHGLSNQDQLLGWMQVFGYALFFVFVGFMAIRSARIRSLDDEADRLSALVAYIIRTAFWAVLLIGLIDAVISFLRIENFLESLIGTSLTNDLGRPSFRGMYVHYLLTLVAFACAWRIKKISFAWLTLLVVIAEFLIVISRFIFSYEQAFMGDLVRFWYAGLFLFASAYTLLHEGHVRVDVLYARFSDRTQALVNLFGSLVFGIPLCWIVLMQGMGGRGDSINSPLLSFEVSQSAYGMYVKYIMAGFLIVFALTMIVQFVATILRSLIVIIASEPEQSKGTDNQAEHHSTEVTGI